MSQPARLVRLVQFSKVFVSRETTSIFYQIWNNLSTTFLSFFQFCFKPIFAALSDNSYISLSSQDYFVKNFFTFSVNLKPALLRQPI